MKKYILPSLILWSIILMLVLSNPLWVNRTDYDGARYYVMWISGLLGIVIMTWQWVLGIRPAFNWLSSDFFHINYRHKRLGIWTMMALIFHPIATVIAYGTSWVYAFSLDFSDSFEWRVSLGKIGFDLTIIILVTSILSRKIMNFRTWHRIHLLSYPTFLAIWLHSRYSGTMIRTIPAVSWYMIVIGIVLVAITVLRIAYQFGYMKNKSQIIAHRKVATDTYEITMSYDKNISYVPGQFVYLQYPRGGESHPYTILSYDKQHKTMRVAYKVFGAWTQKLASLSETTGQTIYVDGPYGDFTANIQNSDAPVVCIAAGIGITPFYELINTYAETKEIKLIYLNRKNADVSYKSDLEEKLEDDCIHILSREWNQTQQNEIVWSRLSTDILEQQLWKLIHTANFYICGGWSVIESVREMLTQLWVQNKRIEREPFDM